MRHEIPYWRVLASEAFATFILVFFGTGAVHLAVFGSARTGILQVAIVWGLAISLASYAAGAISGAHMNPAITLAFAAFRGFPVRRVVPYIAVQLLGAIAAAALLYGLYHNLITQFEAAHQLTRGLPGSELSAMVYGEYFPNPGLPGVSAGAVTLLQAMLAEGIGAGLLAFFVFAVTDARNNGRLHAGMAPLMIGLVVAILISIIAPLTQAGLNPARDFGPRLFAFFAGWGSIAIPGPMGGFFTVYILSPIAGALLGAAVYQFIVCRPRNDIAKGAKGDLVQRSMT